MTLLLLLATTVLALLAGPAAGEDPPVSTFTSPSGEWSLTVTRPDRTWNGPVELVLKKNDVEVWRGEHELGLRQALVSDEGRVAGFGYTGENPAEYPSPTDPPRGRTLRVFVLAPDGALVLDEPHARGGPLYPDGPCNPLVAGCFLQPELDRFVVRVHDEDINRGAEQWWAYDLATSAVLFRERPRLKLGLAKPIFGILSADSVPGTPLVLVRWNHFDSTSSTVSIGSRFQLVDPDWNVVWSFEAVKEHARDRDRFAGGGLGATFGERSFELPTAKAGERARFVVKLEGAHWTVIEVERVAAGGVKKPSR